jgi:regulator of sirC expression with transglutaminase-like and TPR domain
MLRGVAYYQMKNYTAAKADLEKVQNDPRYGAQAQKILKNIPK